MKLDLNNMLNNLLETGPLTIKFDKETNEIVLVNSGYAVITCSEYLFKYSLSNTIRTLVIDSLEVELFSKRNMIIFFQFGQMAFMCIIIRH